MADRNRCRRGFIKGRRWGTIPKFQIEEFRHDVCLLPFGHDCAHVVYHDKALLCFSDSGSIVGTTEQAEATLAKHRSRAVK